MELIDGIAYTLLISGWFCGGIMTAMTHFDIFILLGFGVSFVSFLYLGSKSILQMTTTSA